MYTLICFLILGVSWLFDEFFTDVDKNYMRKKCKNTIQWETFHHSNAPIDQLPQELFVHIFQYLDLKTLCRVAGVSKLWNEVTQYGDLWKSICLKQEAETISRFSLPKDAMLKYDRDEEWKEMMKLKTIHKLNHIEIPFDLKFYMQYIYTANNYPSGSSIKTRGIVNMFFTHTHIKLSPIDRTPPFRMLYIKKEFVDSIIKLKNGDCVELGFPQSCSSFLNSATYIRLVPLHHIYCNQ
eukprot:TRINITY_DN1274_c1_g1_i1.p1 TRINITY_DN1274_c1_g1~~TRINITY_DN1274_c1_g1_i1.p1  ORF type:complete len:238 (-),score=18.22 TRINITY_DN1274_c1_g1_i1:187-900(-)